MMDAKTALEMAVRLEPNRIPPKYMKMLEASVKAHCHSPTDPKLARDFKSMYIDWQTQGPDWENPTGVKKNAVVAIRTFHRALNIYNEHRKTKA